MEKVNGFFDLKNEKTSIAVYLCKFFAILLVVAAHTCLIPDEFGNASFYSSRVLYVVAPLGVGIFFCVSGFLFELSSSKNKPFFQFLLNKIKSIAIPWVIASTLIYIYISIRNGWDLKLYFLSLVGYQSSFWYLTVIFLLYICFFFICKYIKGDWIHYLLGLLTITFVVLEFTGCLPINELTIYLNPFNWIIFFSAGILFARHRKFYEFARKIQIVWYFLFFAFVFCFVYFNLKYSYFVWYYIPICFICVLAIVCFSSLIAIKNRIILFVADIGNASFSIYLFSELLWCGLITSLFNKVDFFLLVLIRPILVLLITYFEIKIPYWILLLFKAYKTINVYSILVGYRPLLTKKNSEDK